MRAVVVHLGHAGGHGTDKEGGRKSYVLFW